MNRRHAGIIALLLAGSAATGVAAVTKSTSIGQAANGVSDAEVAKRKAELDAWQQKIEAQLAEKPPKIEKRQPAAVRSSTTSNRALVTYASDSTPVSEPSWPESTPPAPVSTSSSSRARRDEPADDVEKRETPERDEVPATPGADEPAQTAAASPAVVASAPGEQPASAPVTHSSSSPTGVATSGDDSEHEEEHEAEVEHESEGGDD